MFLLKKGFWNREITSSKKTVFRILAVPLFSYFHYLVLYPVFVLLSGGFALGQLGFETVHVNFLEYLFKLFSLPVFPFNAFSPAQTSFNEGDLFIVWTRISLILVLIDYILIVLGVQWHRSTKQSIKVFLSVFTFVYGVFWLGLPFIERAEDASLLSLYGVTIFFYLLSCVVVYVNFHIAGLLGFLIKGINSRDATEAEIQAAKKSYEENPQEASKKFWKSVWE